MKLSFTTLACPNWTLDKITEAAIKFGYDAIDFRGYTGQIRIFELKEFNDKLDETKEKIKSCGLSVSAFSSSVNACPENEEVKNNFISEIKAYTRLCDVFDTKFIRIFGGKLGNRSRLEALKDAKKFLSEIAKIAEDNNIEIVIETHDDWTSSDNLLKLIEVAASPYINALWDIHHPYRFCSESPAETWNKIGKYVKYTHWKDSKKIKSTDGKDSFKLCLCGEGDIPFAEILTVLKLGGYDGYLTFEWEKQWHPEIEEPEIALPTFVESIRKLS
ncbi:MAG TPA: sugar phosphate isomerase/epimerase family protein [Victivallales bacterium]|nr:sugar phosphate isomerase/epimerase family protein [Victivallales bacterium]HPO91529.1 sugar phosphate isomerase/epimerase family protein [Victivallales bacterium]HRR06307.1 sugar phosphate isomerase/epimerase family protein [Victivallales bacterium]HRR28954.1 sugar phosphate isomerase/epimerase family protein [Victivallales bacterium]HRU01206.1 sugar phosphate isomerase/epimerase family protein [Victivallales bacterium]